MALLAALFLAGVAFAAEPPVPEAPQEQRSYVVMPEQLWDLMVATLEEQTKLIERLREQLREKNICGKEPT